jgi:hypothetical protein
MSFTALAKSFSRTEIFPIPVNTVLHWLRSNTDHKDIRLHPVVRDHKSFRGGFRRFSVSRVAYDTDPDIVSQIFYGEDLPENWKRLVIVKEALHIFDPTGECVDTPEKLRRLIPSIISREVQASPIFHPAMNDNLGVFRALSVLIPTTARVRFRAALDKGTLTIEEISKVVDLPDSYVDIWLRFGEEFETFMFSNGNN